jgi:diguanylate cyclase (GGDEF)-like protein
MTTHREVPADGGRGVSAAGGGPALLYQNARTRVTRVPGAVGGAGDAAVICKEPLGPGSVHRVRRERTLLELLAGIDGVPSLAEVPSSGPAYAAPDTAIVLADTGGVVLADTLRGQRFEVPALVDFALRLTRVIAEVHRRGVVHKDINPGNIVVSGTPPRPMLIDYDLATTFAEERPGFTHESQIAGTLGYLAPEQTGRTGRAVDQRADLYALGATLYELATGRPPFGAGDPLELIHAHLAQVPAPPTALNPAVPAALSDIILRLLEKEPDRRYQSADGLAYDLTRLRDAAGADAGFALGQRDFPLRLVPPSRLVGRDGERERLGTALADAVAGKARGILVAGAPGVGKTALIDELRPMVTTRGGWFVAGKFDQYRRDVPTDAVAQAMRALGRLLLAEPDAELVALRARMREALGADAGLIAAVLPEFGALLDVTPEPTTGDPAEVEGRLFRAGLHLLRTVVSPARPVVMVVDDLQWAGSTPIAFLDAVLMDDSLAGLLLVGAYREAEVDAAHPLSAMLSRWQRSGSAPPVLRLGNLPAADLGALLAEMLRLPPGRAATLAAEVGPRTDGNPYDTVELINAVRRDGLLEAGPDGWRWDPAALRSHVGATDVVELLVARMDRLPEPARELLDVMACLGGEVETGLLQAAGDWSAPEVEQRLAPALEDGLLVLELRGDLSGESTVRFRHDRVQQAGYHRLDPATRRGAHLTAARRLAGNPDLSAMAAQQYLAAADDVTEPSERRRVAELFRRTAAAVQLTNYAAAEHFLAAAMGLLAGADLPPSATAGRRSLALVRSSPAPDPADPLLVALQVERHAALYRLGRLAEADALYRLIDARRPDPLELVEPACVQISSLTNRGLPQEATALGLDLLGQLGLAVPGRDELDAEVARGLDGLYRWVAGVDGVDAAGDRSRPEMSDPRSLAAAKIINRCMPPAFFSDQAVLAWLVIEAGRLWAAHGPCAALVAPLSHAGVVTIAQRQDYRTGYGAVRHALEISAARGYEPETSQARFLFSVSTGHWFEPLEDDIRQARRAHEGLVRGGDLLFACFTYHTTTPSLLDCAATLDGYAAEVESGIAFAARTGNEQTTAASVAFRQLVRSLRGETAEPGGFNDAAFDEAAYLADMDRNPMAAAYFHIARGTAAALFGDTATLDHHSAAALPLLPFIGSHYSTARAYLLRALALADRARGGAAAARESALSEFAACRDWLALRAADAPGNFGHLLPWLDAERAWAEGDRDRAATAFDRALVEVAPRQRPWHRALVTERAARFHLDAGLQYAGRRLLAEAAGLFRAWGAVAKVTQLEAAHPFLAGQDASQRHGSSVHTIGVSSQAIDLLAVVKASQVLSSETDLGRLRARVVEVLGAMTGATLIRVLLWSEEAGGWFLPATGDGDGPARGAALGVDAAAAQGLLPLTAFRYAERTREPLLVEDATRDDRFARDPYLSGLDRCSLLVVPILTQGAPRAMLLLENRLSGSVFSADRLDAVMLIAGQLAVSLDNAMLYASLAEKVAERTAALEAANERLKVLSITDPLTGLDNRRRMAEVLEAEWSRGCRAGGPVAVVMIDIDHFKPYNDHYGHLAGDACLRRVAAALSQTIRSTDLLARYGGEEFAMILPGADDAVASEVAERARAAVAALAEPHAAAPAGVVTVSVGVAVGFPNTGLACDELVEHADAGLYAAKRHGRNQVRRHEVAGPVA